MSEEVEQTTGEAEPEDFEMKPERYRAIGLVANPYDAQAGRQDDPLAVRMMVRAACTRLLGAIDAAASEERSRPVRVVKSSEVPNYYLISTLALSLSQLGERKDIGVLPVYVPLTMMRLGKARGPLSQLADIIAGPSLGRTLAAHARSALGTPDTTLGEWTVLADADLAPLLERLESEPAEAIAEIYGPPEITRDKEDPTGAIEGVMRKGTARQSILPEEPDEDAATAEESDIDQAIAAVAEIPEVEGELEEQELDAVVEEAEGPDPEQEFRAAVGDYLIAHLIAHFSPVLGRAVRAYREQGTAAMSQELKITRAPRKTIAALARFATLCFRKMVFVYDQLDQWPEIPDDARVAIVSGLSDVRFALGSTGVICVLAGDDGAPEIDELFMGAPRVEWDMSELIRLQGAGDPPADREALLAWLESAMLPDADADALRALVEEAIEGTERLSEAVAAADRAIEQAVDHA